MQWLFFSFLHSQLLLLLSSKNVCHIGLCKLFVIFYFFCCWYIGNVGHLVRMNDAKLLCDMSYRINIICNIQDMIMIMMIATSNFDNVDTFFFDYYYCWTAVIIIIILCVILIILNFFFLLKFPFIYFFDENVRYL